jgi:membrane protease YdiL (CAAX protease family)
LTTPRYRPMPARLDRLHLTPERSAQTPGPHASSFSLTLVAALGLALLAAAMIAPVAALMIAAAGFRFPFPRIFDRTVMATLFATLLLFAPRLKLLAFLRGGFGGVMVGVWEGFGGLVLAGAAMAVLFALAAIAGVKIRGSVIPWSVLRYLPAAVLISVIEEGFFRAFLLAGMEGELGSPGALFASSAVFAIVHVIRSPARFYLTKFEPMAGVENLAAYAERIIRPEVGPPLLGLFLLGLVLGQAFVATRSVYPSLGLHVGLVLGAKTWRLAAGDTIPRWLAGTGPVPLVAAPAAWAVSVIMLIVLLLWPGPTPALRYSPSGGKTSGRGERGEGEFPQ